MGKSQQQLYIPKIIIIYIIYRLILSIVRFIKQQLTEYTW